MDTFPSSPPAAVAADRAALRASLDLSGTPPKTLDLNVLIAAWNIRGFGRVLENAMALASTDWLSGIQTPMRPCRGTKFQTPPGGGAPVPVSVEPLPAVAHEPEPQP